MGLMPENIVKDQYVKLYQSKNSALMRLLAMVLVIVALLWAKNVLFGWFADITGLSAAERLATGTTLFWISLIFYFFFVVYTIMKLRTTFYEIFPDRVVLQAGIIARNRKAVDMHEFGQVLVEIGIVGRILNFGTIIFEYKMLGPAGDIGVDFYNVNDPQRYEHHMNVMLNRASREGGRMGDNQEHKTSEDSTSEDYDRAAGAMVAAVESQNTYEPDVSDMRDEHDTSGYDSGSIEGEIQL